MGFSTISTGMQIGTGNAVTPTVYNVVNELQTAMNQRIGVLGGSPLSFLSLSGNSRSPAIYNTLEQIRVNVGYLLFAAHSDAQFLKDNETEYADVSDLLTEAGYSSGWIALPAYVQDLGPCLQQMQDMFGVLKKYRTLKTSSGQETYPGYPSSRFSGAVSFTFGQPPSYDFAIAWAAAKANAGYLLQSTPVHWEEAFALPVINGEEYDQGLGWSLALGVDDEDACVVSIGGPVRRRTFALTEVVGTLIHGDLEFIAQSRWFDNTITFSVLGETFSHTGADSSSVQEDIFTLVLTSGVPLGGTWNCDLTIDTPEPAEHPFSHSPDHFISSGAYVICDFTSGRLDEVGAIDLYVDITSALTYG